jgi:hypothetical protein
MAQDTLNIAGLAIPQQHFLNAIIAQPRTFFHWYFDYNGVLGLAPTFAGDNFHVLSPWQMMVREGLLDRNMFSLSPPTGNRDIDHPRTNGELVLGGYPSHFNLEESVTLPLISTSKAHPWATTFQSLRYGDDLSEVFDSGTAYFSTSLPYIILPGTWAKSVLDVIGTTGHDGFFESFPCESRESLPNLTIGIGDQSFVLSAFQYSFELGSSSHDTHDCVVAFERGKEQRLGLGWPFMENFHVVFDQGAEAVMRKSYSDRVILRCQKLTSQSRPSWQQV